ncbi:hypothetical protein [Bradyrhizobium oligotrophicum]
MAHLVAELRQCLAEVGLVADNEYQFSIKMLRSPKPSVSARCM